VDGGNGDYAESSIAGSDCEIAATAEERLREASAEVFRKFGDTLRERLQQIAAVI